MKEKHGHKLINTNKNNIKIVIHNETKKKKRKRKAKDKTGHHHTQLGQPSQPQTQPVVTYDANRNPIIRGVTIGGGGVADNHRQLALNYLAPALPAAPAAAQLLLGNGPPGAAGGGARHPLHRQAIGAPPPPPPPPPPARAAMRIAASPHLKKKVKLQAVHQLDKEGLMKVKTLKELKAIMLASNPGIPPELLKQLTAKNKSDAIDLFLSGGSMPSAASSSAAGAASSSHTPRAAGANFVPGRYAPGGGGGGGGGDSMGGDRWGQFKGGSLFGGENSSDAEDDDAHVAIKLKSPKESTPKKKERTIEQQRLSLFSSHSPLVESGTLPERFMAKIQRDHAFVQQHKPTNMDEIPLPTPPHPQEKEHYVAQHVFSDQGAASGVDLLHQNDGGGVQGADFSFEEQRPSTGAEHIPTPPRHKDTTPAASQIKLHKGSGGGGAAAAAPAFDISLIGRRDSNIPRSIHIANEVNRKESKVVKPIVDKIEKRQPMKAAVVSDYSTRSKTSAAAAAPASGSGRGRGRPKKDESLIFG